MEEEKTRIWKVKKKWNKWMKMTNYVISKMIQCKWTLLKKKTHPQKWTNKRRKKTILLWK